MSLTAEERGRKMEIRYFTAEDRVKRFPLARIIEHWTHVLFFCVLVCTGLTQRFYSLDISQWIILRLGGIDAVRLIHRFAGVLFSLGVGVHVLAAAIGIVYKQWQPSMIITKKDFTDVVHNVRYYLGLENASTRGGRYTYKQKFEYWGILTGVLLMIFSGVILWFPTVVTKFMPGEIIPAAKVLHTNEALVVFLIIAIWHIYNAIFSPEVFPLDTSMFTGYISKERMLLEHPDELAGIEEGSTDQTAGVSLKK
jgi:formate dehydrogenase subunit gamma